MCTGALWFQFYTGCVSNGYYIQAIQNGNSAVKPFVWNANYNGSVTYNPESLQTQPISFIFYNNTNSGSIAISISAYYSGGFSVVAGNSTYMQLVRIA
jgi:hypothetical protein